MSCIRKRSGLGTPEDDYRIAVTTKSRMNRIATTQITGCTSLACFLPVSYTHLTLPTT